MSRRFVAATETALAQLLAADLSGLDLVALMVDGVHFGEHTCVVALGIDIDGIKHPLALVEGSTENATLVTELIVGLRERGLDVTRPILAVLDGSKALRRAVVDVFDRPVIGRCQRAGAEAVLAESGVPGVLISSLAATPPHRPPRAAAAPSRRCFRHCWPRRRARVSCGVACSVRAWAAKSAGDVDPAEAIAVSVRRSEPNTEPSYDDMSIKRTISSAGSLRLSRRCSPRGCCPIPISG